MTPARRFLPAIAVASACLLGACVVGGPYDGGPYGGGVAVYDGGYYEPQGYEVGGWGGGYHVGPGRGGERSGRAQTTHSYRPAAAGRASPSIPSRSRRR
jgi:hypothetical protein